MKSLLFRGSRRSGFTLVELLVVMGIIAILAGVLLAGVSSAIRFAKRTKANSTANQISTAVQNYYTEYGVYPTADATGAAGTDDYYAGDDTGPNKWAPLIIALCGNMNPYNSQTVTGNAVPNTRGIAYLSPTHSDIDQTGRMVNPFDTMANGTANPPGGGTAFFYMVVDTDYSGVAGDSGTEKGLLPNFSSSTYATMANGVPGGAAVWCSCDQNSAGTNYKPAFWAHTY